MLPVTKGIVHTELAPAAMGPYSQGTVYKNMLRVSGQIGCTLIDGQMPDEIETQAKNALYSFKSVVEAAGSRLDRVLKVTVFLTNMDDFKTVNQIYGRFFPDNPPARECVEVRALPKGAKIEISGVAYVREDY